MALQSRDAVAKFSARFFNELDKNKNVVSSPLSAEIVLALLTLGASGTAHSELISALGIPDDDSIRSSFSEIATKIKSIKGVTLNVANKVYLKEGPYELEPKLEKDAVQVFDAAFEKVNFANSDASAKLINGWVESKTNKKIKDLFTPDSFNDDTRLVLVNAIYFKGTWKHKFDESSTEEKPFNVNRNTKINLPMMHQEQSFNYGESKDLNAQLLEMQYVGDETSMLIILPKEIEGLQAIQKKLADGYNIFGDLDSMRNRKVQVMLPKFKIETEMDLLDILPKLGIKAIFSGEGLSKILKNGEPLFVSKAVQKAFIEVNEEGAEAAAATAVGIAFCSAIIEHVEQFIADRPFLAVIMVREVPYFYATFQGDN